MQANNTNNTNNTNPDFTIFSPQIEGFVPFAGNVDPSRLNMASKQQTQAVVSKNTEMPLLVSKNYKKLTTINSPFLEIAEDDGFVIYNNDNVLLIYYKNQKKLISRYLPDTKKMVNTSISLKYKINKTSFKKDEVLYDYTNLDIETKIPKIGYRAKTLYMQWFGYNSDDAVIISESFSNKTEIDYYEKVYIPITKYWKYYRIKRNDEEELETFLPLLGKNIDVLTRFEKINIENHFISEISNTDKRSSKFFSKTIDGIKNGEIQKIKAHLFYKGEKEEITPDNYKEIIKELDDKYIYNKGLIPEFQEILDKQFQEYQKIKESFTSLGLTEDKVETMTEDLFHQYFMMNQIPKHYKQFLREHYNLDDTDIDGLLEIDIKITKKTSRGDKFTNLFAGKATSAMVIPDKYMPKDENGKPYDLIFNTLGIPGRNNWGVIFEALLSKIIDDVERQAKKIQWLLDDNKDVKDLVKSFKERIEFINEKFIKLYDNDYYDKIKHFLTSFNKTNEFKVPIWNLMIKDINKKGFYLFVPNFANLSYNTLYREFAEPYSEKFQISLKKEEVEISEDFMGWLREKYNFKGPFYDTDKSVVKAMSGTNYILKLHHTGFSKHNSVAFTSSYSKITGQPVRGRKKSGGQHISWQSLAALLAHKEDNAILKEFYTIKSDAVDEKENFLMKYIRDGKYHLKNRYNSVTKKTLNNALKMFCMEFEENES